MRQRILKWTGLPVSVGIGATKTLSKLANHCEKKRPLFHGVYNFNAMHEIELNHLLAQIAVGEVGVWGVNSRLSLKHWAFGLCWI